MLWFSCSSPLCYLNNAMKISVRFFFWFFCLSLPECEQGKEDKVQTSVGVAVSIQQQLRQNRLGQSAERGLRRQVHLLSRGHGRGLNQERKHAFRVSVYATVLCSLCRANSTIQVSNALKPARARVISASHTSVFRDKLSTHMSSTVCVCCYLFTCPLFH